MLSLLRVWVQSLVGKLRSRKLHGINKQIMCYLGSGGRTWAIPSSVLWSCERTYLSWVKEQTGMWAASDPLSLWVLRQCISYDAYKNQHKNSVTIIGIKWNLFYGLGYWYDRPDFWHLWCVLFSLKNEDLAFKLNGSMNDCGISTVLHTVPGTLVNRTLEVNPLPSENICFVHLCKLMKKLWVERAVLSGSLRVC